MASLNTKQRRKTRTNTCLSLQRRETCRTEAHRPASRFMDLKQPTRLCQQIVHISKRSPRRGYHRRISDGRGAAVRYRCSCCVMTMITQCACNSCCWCHVFSQCCPRDELPAGLMFSAVRLPTDSPAMSSLKNFLSLNQCCFFALTLRSARSLSLPLPYVYFCSGRCLCRTGSPSELALHDSVVWCDVLFLSRRKRSAVNVVTCVGNVCRAWLSLPSSNANYHISAVHGH